MLVETKVYYYNSLGQLIDTAQMKYEINDDNELKKEMDDYISEIKESAGDDEWALEVYNSKGNIIYTTNSNEEEQYE